MPESEELDRLDDWQKPKCPQCKRRHFPFCHDPLLEDGRDLTVEIVDLDESELPF